MKNLSSEYPPQLPQPLYPRKWIVSPDPNQMTSPLSPLPGGGGAWLLSTPPLWRPFVAPPLLLWLLRILTHPVSSSFIHWPILLLPPLLSILLPSTTHYICPSPDLSYTSPPAPPPPFHPLNPNTESRIIYISWNPPNGPLRDYDDINVIVLGNFPSNP